MKHINIKVINNSNNELPAYQTLFSAGMDLRAMTDEALELAPLQRTLIGTGLYIELPEGYEAQIRPRSGMAYKNGISVLNAPGTIDADYRGEIKVLLVNLSNESYAIKPGERIAQMVIAEHAQANWQEVNKLAETDRSEGGFGSTGTH